MEFENKIASTKEEVNNNFCLIKDLEFAAACPLAHPRCFFQAEF